MQSSGGGLRWVGLVARAQHVTVEAADGGEVSVSYPGILLTGYEGSIAVCERWVPYGDEPSDEDDERLIAELHAALLWQQREPSPWCDA